MLLITWLAGLDPAKFLQQFLGGINSCTAKPILPVWQTTLETIVHVLDNYS